MTEPVGSVLRRTVEVMGTVVSLALVRPGRDEIEELRQAEAAVAAAAGVLHQADDTFSLWQPQSPMSRLRRGELSLGEAPPEVAEVLALCRSARQGSAGWFDPWAAPGGVDPTGLVKGWAAEQAMVALQGQGQGDAMVNAAGDIVCVGTGPGGRAWRVGIEDPLDPSRLLTVVEGWPAVATSGLYQRGEHIFCPHCGSGHGALSATVIGPELWLADALATAVVAAGPEAGLEVVEAVAGYEVLLTGADGARRASSGFPWA
jgi:thiamine biosynthesis lipoprotein